MNKVNFLGDVTKEWSLFLDRDGVINIERKNDYVRQWSDFVFCENVLKSLLLIEPLFNKIFIVTNQRGVERNLMTISDLSFIHEKMTDAIHLSGGRIDKVYFCTSLSDNDQNRKPNLGMAYQAKSEYPEIHFEYSIMIGNSESDMKFGRNCGMKTVFVTNEDQKTVRDDLVDLYVKDLYEFAKIISN